MSVAAAFPRSHTLRGAGFWVQVLALFVDFLIPTIIPTAIVFAQPAWGGVWVPLTLALTLIYLSAFTARSSRPSLGLWLCRLRVLRASGGDLGLPLAMWRSFLEMWSVALIGLGVIAIAVDQHHQGWHDRLTGTVVLHSR